MSTATPVGYRLAAVPHNRVTIDGGFWGPRLETNRAVTIPTIYRRLREAGHIDALRLAWRPGMPNPPHIFWDSDLAKWLEAASYALAAGPDPTLDATVDETIAALARAQQPDGYLNTHFTAVEPDARWTNLRDGHELYCAGHLIEAAVAHHAATGKRALLDIARRYADHIAGVFGPEPGQRRGYCGHQEIELALVRLARATGEDRYLRLGRFFLDERGRRPRFFDEEARARGDEPRDFRHGTYEYNQSHRPVREQDTAVGHAVRAMYQYCAMADLAHETGDAALLAACERLFASACGRRLYVTGGLGSSAHNEGFTADYDLPNDAAYAETCAAIALFLWLSRMLRFDGDGRYADVMERALYNGILSGIALDGTRFSYKNPLAVARHQDAPDERYPTHRQPWFACACCSPNIARLLASLGGHAYGEGGRDLYVHLYIQGGARLRASGRAVMLRQESDYPWDGRIGLTVEPEGPAPTRFGVCLRVPGWCREARLAVNGEEQPVAPERGYVRVERAWVAGDRIVLDLAMPVERVYAHPDVAADRGRVALQRGPVVYCLEEADNAVPDDPGRGTGPWLDALALPRGAELTAAYEPDVLGGVVTLTGRAVRPADRQGEGAPDTLYRPAPGATTPRGIKAVPYYAWGNRARGEMLVWLREVP